MGKANPNVLPPHQSKNAMEQQPHIDNQLHLIWIGAPLPPIGTMAIIAFNNGILHYKVDTMSTMSKLIQGHAAQPLNILAMEP